MPEPDIDVATENQARAKVPCWQSRDLLRKDNAKQRKLHSLFGDAKDRRILPQSRTVPRCGAAARQMSRFRHNQACIGGQDCNVKDWRLRSRGPKLCAVSLSSSGLLTGPSHIDRE
jgi:hypothetical protein